MLTYHSFNQTFYYMADLLAFTLIISTILISYGVRGEHNPFMLVLAIQLVNDMIGTFQFAVRLSADLESYMTSISRCLAYARLEPEGLLHTHQDLGLAQC